MKILKSVGHDPSPPTIDAYAIRPELKSNV